MADEHNDEANVGTAGQQSHENEFGPQGEQTLSNDANKAGFAGQSGGTRSGSANADRSNISDGLDATDEHESSDSFGQGTTRKPSKSAVVDHQESGGPSGTSGSEAFIGSRDNDASQYLQESSSRSGASSKDATGGADFANQGQGALDREDGQNDGSEVDP